MHLAAYRLSNFRRLRDTHVELERDVTIFVGANNSGKTSAAHALKMFLTGDRQTFTIHDFSAACWPVFDSFDAIGVETTITQEIPRISLDLWFAVETHELHLVLDLLPSLRWSGKRVGIRIEFAPNDDMTLIENFKKAKAEAAKLKGDDSSAYHPWPSTLRQYLQKQLNKEYKLRYYKLAEADFDENFEQQPGRDGAAPLPEGDQGGKNILASLLRIDFMGAQRHLSDVDGGRSENLSSRLAHYYHHLEQVGTDYAALNALAQSESSLNDHLGRVFRPTLESLNTLGYPGIDQPMLQVQSELNPENVLSDRSGTIVQYALSNKSGDTLPDRYNGLGFKNLIYMVVELLEMHERWKSMEPKRPAIHLVFIEEPEAHLHAQVQQVFIGQLDKIPALGCSAPFLRQYVITTHSAHILYERGFKPIRHFRREPDHTSIVGNPVKFFEAVPGDREFLQRYIKHTHCDIFFADVAIMVEGNVERLLLPMMIASMSETLALQTSYIATIEIGGAFAHKFRGLLQFLNIPTLVITDLDSGEGTGHHSHCFPETPDAVTTNPVLKSWLPSKTLVSDLFTATPAERTETNTAGRQAVRVTYQTPQIAVWNGTNVQVSGRTLEEAFAIENLKWTQDSERASLGLGIDDASGLTAQQLVNKIREHVASGRFAKTDFAISLIAEQDSDWVVPAYIKEGLVWLVEQLRPIISDPMPSDDVDAVDL